MQQEALVRCALLWLMLSCSRKHTCCLLILLLLTNPGIFCLKLIHRLCVQTEVTQVFFYSNACDVAVFCFGRRLESRFKPSLIFALGAARGQIWASLWHIYLRLSWPVAICARGVCRLRAARSLILCTRGATILAAITPLVLDTSEYQVW